MARSNSCPFCGSNRLGYEIHKFVYRRCEDCGALGPTSTSEEESRAAWNNRPGERAARARAFREALDRWPPDGSTAKDWLEYRDWMVEEAERGE